MAMTRAQHREQLRALLPPGRALDDGGSGTLTELLDALAQEYGRVDDSADSLVDEADPRTTYELLSDWERIAGLPDPCVGTPGTIEQRRDALVQRLTSRGGQSPAYFIALAQSLGYTVTITEYQPPYVGQSVVGDALTYGDWVFAFTVNAPQTTINNATASNAGAGEPLRAWGNQALECTIRRRKPAHTTVLFAYGG